MTDEIPDDVVERALKAYEAIINASPLLPRNKFEYRLAFRAAGRVFVEWEMERQSLAEATHKKRGTTYDVLAELALLQTDTPLEDMAEVVVYRCRETGDFWVRKYSEFYDGRFDIRSRTKKGQTDE